MKVRQLFSSKEKWSKGGFAIDKSGKTVPVTSHEAFSWCLEGAIHKCYPGIKGMDKRVHIMAKVRDLIDRKSYGKHRDIALWNDAPRRTFKQVKAIVEILNI